MKQGLFGSRFFEHFHILICAQQPEFTCMSHRVTLMCLFTSKYRVITSRATSLNLGFFRKNEYLEVGKQQMDVVVSMALNYLN